jgi:histidinol-phosphate aminotransferase
MSDAFPDPLSLVLPRIRSMHGYAPGEQLNDPEIIKLNTNENPFPVPEAVQTALIDEIHRNRLHKYPDPIASELRAALARKIGRESANILAGNGSDDVLSILFRCLLDERSTFIMPWPTYSLYPVLGDLVGARSVRVPLRSDWSIDFDALLSAVRIESRSGRVPFVIFANPNAPTGLSAERSSVLAFARENPAITIADEAYVEFGAESVMGVAGTEEFPRLIATGTFSKAYSLAGQRIGWLVAHPQLISEMDKIRDSYNLSRLAQVSALAALADEGEHTGRLAIIIETREFAGSEFSKKGFTFPKSKTNFLFVRPPESVRPSISPRERAKAYVEFLRMEKILVRHFDDDACSDYVRITIGTREQMERLLEATDRFQ